MLSFKNEHSQYIFSLTRYYEQDQLVLIFLMKIFFKHTEKWTRSPMNSFYNHHLNLIAVNILSLFFQLLCVCVYVKENPDIMPFNLQILLNVALMFSSCSRAALKVAASDPCLPVSIHLCNPLPCAY